ncbi:hypothetical protein KY290_017355 [Solanum tuberosum]|uniref:Uncharacterized protein n=1 Tax=Solanum tuberosum TaxID=4113 RepID=A0ABQ7VB18_SOLTU|nr:hypothetical protein KY290_017355 [Solanum tuberosum]
MADAEMMEEEKEMKVSGIRDQMKEFDFMAYFYQTFNRTESLRWRNPRYSEQFNHSCYWDYVETCPKYSRKTEEGSHGLSITDSMHKEFHGQPPQKDGRVLLE